MREQFVPTPVGRARLDWYPATGDRRATAVLGHGNATGVEAAELQALARALPGNGISVVLMTQPYRIEHDRRVAGERSLDAAWEAIWPHALAAAGTGPVIAGGRSAGSQVACRTADNLGASAVLVLAYPLLGPGSAAELLAVALPTLVIQGGADPFGRPDQFPPMPHNMRLVEIPSANHMFASAEGGSAAALGAITTAVEAWIDGWEWSAGAPVRGSTRTQCCAGRDEHEQAVGCAEGGRCR